MSPQVTHEDYLHAIAKLAIARRQLTAADHSALDGIKLTYGAGPDGARGVTYFNRWQTSCGCKPKLGSYKPIHVKACKRKGNQLQTQVRPLIAISALYERSPEHLIEVALHELAHVVAGWQAGHENDWKAACIRLGLLRHATAASDWSWEYIEEGAFRKALAALPLPNDGTPLVPSGVPVPGQPGSGPHGQPIKRPAGRPCTAGVGTKGGTSHGKGAGSRQLLYHCQCEPVVKIRHAGVSLLATCGVCLKAFKLVEASVPHSHGRVSAATSKKARASGKAHKAQSRAVQPRVNASRKRLGGLTAADIQRPIAKP